MSRARALLNGARGRMRKHGKSCTAVLATVGATCWRQDRRRMARRLASQLAFLHRIPPCESALVPWLTHEPCTTNADALSEWTSHQLADPRVAPLVGTTRLLDALSERLHRMLTHLEDTRS